MNPISPFYFEFPDEDIAEFQKSAAEVLHSGVLILGKYTERFERSFAEFAGTRHAISVNSGSSALEFLLRLKGVKIRQFWFPPIRISQPLPPCCVPVGTCVIWTCLRKHLLPRFPWSTRPTATTWELPVFFGSISVESSRPNSPMWFALRMTTECGYWRMQPTPMGAESMEAPREILPTAAPFLFFPRR
jgi:hypothetical protein